MATNDPNSAGCKRPDGQTSDSGGCAEISAFFPEIAELSLVKAAKDISQGGLVGTSAMFAECSDVAISINLASIPKPEGVDLERWLQSFPSFGYLLSVRPDRVSDILARFHGRGIAAADIGDVTPGTTVAISDDRQREIIWDFARSPLIGCRPNAGNIRKACA